MGINISYICIYCQKPIEQLEPGWSFSDFGQYHNECFAQFKGQLGGIDE